MTNLVLILLLGLAAVPAGRSVEGGGPSAITAPVLAMAGEGEATRAKLPSPRKRWIQWLQQFTPNGDWPSFVPGGGGLGGSSQEDVLYSSFYGGNCRKTLHLARRGGGTPPVTPLAEPRRSLYEGAAAACLAAFHGRHDLWPIAGSRFDRVRGADMNCKDRAVLRILQEIVKAHRADPTVQFVRGQGRTVHCSERQRRGVAGFVDAVVVAKGLGEREVPVGQVRAEPDGFGRRGDRIGGAVDVDQDPGALRVSVRVVGSGGHGRVAGVQRVEIAPLQAQ